MNVICKNIKKAGSCRECADMSGDTVINVELEFIAFSLCGKCARQLSDRLDLITHTMENKDSLQVLDAKGTEVAGALKEKE